MKKNQRLVIVITVLLATMLANGIFLFSYFMVQTIAIQYAAQTVKPFFNSTVITESTTGDAALLGKLLQEGDAVVAFLYNHKSWKSSRVAEVFQSTAEYFEDENVKWFAINCAWSQCGKGFPQESLPTIQFYVKPRTKNAQNVPTVMKRDMYSRTEMIEFVRSNLYPVNLIYAEGHLKEQKIINIMDYRLNGNLYISPPYTWFGKLNDKENGLFELMHEIRLLQKITNNVSVIGTLDHFSYSSIEPFQLSRTLLLNYMVKT